MSRNIPPVFGKRSRISQADGKQQVGVKLWSVWMLAALLFGAVAVSGTILLSPLNGTTASREKGEPALDNSAFVADFSPLLADSPEKARFYVISGLENCLPADARKNWTSDEIKDLAVAIYLKTFSLLSEDINPDQRDQAFREWLVPVASKLPLEQQDTFRDLVANGLSGTSMRDCVAAEVQRAIHERI